MSSERPVIAFHLVLTCYGFWLPNDPRGSNSDTVWAEALKPFGPATKVAHARSVAAVPHDRSARLAAKQVLRHPPVRLSGTQAQAAARGFADALERTYTRCRACCVMPDHVHLVVDRPAGSVERFISVLKGRAVHAMSEARLHPYQTLVAAKRPKVWARGGRHVFLFDAADVRRAVGYVENNPVKHGLRAQRWSFVGRSVALVRDEAPAKDAHFVRGGTQRDT